MELDEQPSVDVINAGTDGPFKAKFASTWNPVDKLQTVERVSPCDGWKDVHSSSQVNIEFDGEEHIVPLGSFHFSPNSSTTVRDTRRCSLLLVISPTHPEVPADLVDHVLQIPL